jgi:hypothetical protein
MEDFVVVRAEREGHILLFEDRNKIWNFVKDNILGDLCAVLKEKHDQLCCKYAAKKKDGLVHLQIDWHKWLSSERDGRMAQFCCQQNIGSGDLHCRIIMRTVGKYVVAFLRQKEDETNATKRCSKKLIKKAKKTLVKKQPDYGLQVLAGGTLGAMFRLFKRNRDKYKEQYVILRQMIIGNKTEKNVPVQQRARDWGGLYVIKSDFLPTIRCLDGQITEEFANAKKHGRKLIQVSQCIYVIM